MIIGTANIDDLAEHAATMQAFYSEDIHFGDVTCFQLTAEMRNAAREAVLPPSLHPTIPAALSVQAYRVQTSPWGPFQYVTVRVSCRSGVRARGFTTATVTDSDTACTALREKLGYPARVGQIYFRSSYDGVAITVDEQDVRILEIDGIDPDPMGSNDIQYTGNDISSRVDRLSSRLSNFSGAAWGNPLMAPYLVIASSVAKMELTIPAIRFVCKPEELAFTGTEPVERENLEIK